MGTLDNRISVLLVDDDGTLAVSLSECLGSDRWGAYRLHQVGLLSEALMAVRVNSFDVALLDLSLPDSEGLVSCARIRNAAPTLPVIILTSTDDDRLALQAVGEGAQDYLVKTRIDAEVLPRSIHYAIERKRAEESLRQSEEFFRLISENVTDLISVVDSAGRRVYNSPSYTPLLGDPSGLKGTDCFAEIHPDDRDRMKRMFAETLATGVGQRAEYRMITRRGVRHLESQGSLISDPAGRAPRIVVVARDITERRQTIEVLREALSDLSETHEQLKATQRQLIEAERVQAVSTFAAGVAHEVKNPLQTIILGVDYLASHVPEGQETSVMILREMADAVHRADAIIRGLMEFASVTKPSVREENLNEVIEHSIQAVQSELTQYPVQLVRNLAVDLPPLAFQAHIMKQVLINLLLHALRTLHRGGRLIVSTSTRTWEGPQPNATGAFSQLKPGDPLVVAQVECIVSREETGKASENQQSGKYAGLGITVLKKIIELYGGAIETSTSRDLSTYCVMFRVQPETHV
jgi:PAS domain S-box-containing protein